jgi:hypothetical protein
MAITPGRTTDRMAAFIMYGGMVFFFMWVGIRLVIYALDARFCYHYLLEWKTAIDLYREEEPPFPVFLGNNHAEYMETLARRIQKNGISVPKSNTGRPYIYRPRTLWWSKVTQDMFILCTADKIIIYSMPQRLFERLDTMIDDRADMTGGRFTARPGKKKGSVIGLFKI